MTDNSQEFPAGEQMRWYNSEAALELTKELKYGLAKGIMYLLAAVGVGIGIGKMVSYEQEARAQARVLEVEAKNKVEYQRLRTLEEITRSFGPKMSPQEFKDFLREYKLQPQK
ncbi:MAG: hypothetical protein AABX13_04245 [Nanoarchaeota archaeon]